ncbi:glucoamylase family protein [Herbivorax sp. ANBcel31]|uniref:GH36-type glycosyl hydrolase domain-containing protein n=1 Tax=Herbivorax sp. ANBcel31 TaxID=3069754 RepID=UPI0027AEFBA6|nr:glucoamylase family protein [Herbivorax sp. ANBcel31]MDQ2087331.1 glucoamylase family protein [Herbivorax sp. ANBcel31]
MQLYVNIIIILSFIAVVLLWLLLKRNSDRQLIKIRDAALTCDELEEHAREIAYDHNVLRKPDVFNWPVPRMNENYKYIVSVYKMLNEDVQKGIPTTPDAEWLLDNFYIIEEQVKGVRRDLSKDMYLRLPAISSGSLKGYARIYALALELVSHTDGRIDENVLINYINAYQSNNVLTGREIWALAVMIKIAIVENIKYLCEKIEKSQNQRRKVEQIISAFDKENNDISEIINNIDLHLNKKHHVDSTFIEHLSYKLRKMGKNYAHVLRHVDDRLSIKGTSLDEISHKEHREQTQRKGSIGNCIISLKFISTTDWVEVFEALSKVEEILRQDPFGTYPLMDLASRNYYRKRLEELSQLFNVSEIHVAKKAVELSLKEHQNSDSKNIHKGHVGYYIIGKGIKELEKAVGYEKSFFGKAMSFFDSHPTPAYIGGISVIILIILGFTAEYIINKAGYEGSIVYVLLALAAIFIPATDIAVNTVNWMLSHIVKPSFLPKLEMKEGIPEELSTMVVIPALLPDDKRAVELIESLEVYYLANKEKNIYFALVGDYKDSSKENMPGDEKIVDAALSKVSELNKKYGEEGEEIFYFFHRHRQFNERQNKWMGWERKRGALIEFNNMILGSKKTGFSILSRNIEKLPRVKYIITLDADTVLPLGVAKRLIGTMSHPLNRPVVDDKRGLVVEGYGLLQPRIGFEIESVNKSLFSRIFAGEEGIDPYATATSDVYQDLFEEGIFTGKGIYDLTVFQSILEDAIPENAVLSHDLLEGSYVRAGLVTDLELIDGYPAKYSSYAMRQHRWVRGDWQLIPWIFKHIKNQKGDKVRNPLSIVARWKIVDNLRRSVMAPAIMILIILAFSVLPGSVLFWLGVALLSVFFPLITGGIDYIVSKPLSALKSKSYTPAICGLKACLFQQLLQFVFLPYQAYLMVNAILITIVRVFFTKRNMLEWVTALDAEKSLKDSIKSYVIRMRFAILQAIIILGLSMWLKPDAVAVAASLSIIWVVSPYIAYKVSEETVYKKESISKDDILEVRRIARKTWRFFEDFVDKRNNYLPPDNYQEDPPNGVAYRTSPTNIGLGMLSVLAARDFGYIGTVEMYKIVERTVATIEKMEKWNGHLYNWYDTRTLNTLKPAYVSTVDSGNFVGYLITLKEGLIEYLKKPLLDKNFVYGLRDTLGLIQKENDKFYPDTEYLDKFLESDETFLEIDIWINALDRLFYEKKNKREKPDIWKIKTNNMINNFKEEVEKLLSWSSLIGDIPQELTDNNKSKDVKKLIDTILKRLKTYIPLKDLPKEYGEIIIIIEKLEKIMKRNKVKDIKILWIDRLKKSLSTSIENADKLIKGYMGLIERIRKISDDTEFNHLYDKKMQLFSIGYDVQEGSITNSYYDLIGSEARQTSYIAIARGEVEEQHWFKLGRTLTQIDSYKGMVSWSGTMFEYLMPLLIMKRNKNTLMDETYSFVVRSQKKYGKQRNVPWGTSESGFYAFDIDLNYQYKAFGVPWLGLKRGLVEDMVVAPYATMLAIQVDPAGSIKNLKKLDREGANGSFGFYEALDYTPERLPMGEKRGIVKSYMAHHQGMSLLSLDNWINDNIMQNRFHKDPVVEAAKLLLQEKVPANIVFTKENKEKVIPFKDVVYEEEDSHREYEKPNPVLPRVHILSNGSYSVMVTDKGTGYSRCKNLDITRWREDVVLDSYGMLFYFRDTKKDEAWSSSYNLYGKKPDNYKVSFISGEARFFRQDGNIDTLTQVAVSASDNAEIRKVTLTNHEKDSCVMEITSYFELVLAPHGSDVAHPAFSNLFIRTEFVSEYNSIIASRRPRMEGEKTLWVANTLSVDGEVVGGVQFDTNRLQFLGRGRNISDPVVLEPNKPLTNSAGPVLDPVMSLRQMVKIEPESSVKISFVTILADSRDELLEKLEKYSSQGVISEEFDLALTRSRVEARYLNLKAKEIEFYQELMPHILFISPGQRLRSKCILDNKKGQSALWAYGISGDIPIVLVMLDKTDDIDIIYDILKAHEYWKFKNLKVDLVIINEEGNSYNNPLQGLLNDVIRASHAHDMINRPGGVFILKKSNMKKEDIDLICATARIVLDGSLGNLEEQLMKEEKISLPEFKQFESEVKSYERKTFIEEEELSFYNGIGGFGNGGKEYVIHLEKNLNTPLPWINVISNQKFGFLVTESGSGYSWYENSRENKLTPWSNDPVSDTPGEILYLCDNSDGKVWSATPLPIRNDGSYKIKHGFGYTVFEHECHGIWHSMVQFVPVSHSVKISIMKIKNTSENVRNLSFVYYIRPVLGVSDQFTAPHVNTSMHDLGTILITNNYNEEFSDRVTFVDSSIETRSVTGDRREFFGTGDIKKPDGIKQVEFSGRLGAGLDPCVALNVNINLKAGEEKEIVFLLGAGKSEEEVKSLVTKYREVGEAKKAFNEVKDFWSEKLGRVQFYTPDTAMDYLLNGWLMYQVVSCRMWTRSAFYQSGGAYGFRDQLQDSMAVTHVWPDITKNQILLHSKHQFLEGDVQHWWHEEEYKGTRTRFSDDLLWMAYVTAEYIKITEDYGILSEKTPFLEDEPLKDFEDEAYRIPKVSETVGTLYEHCIRAIDRSLKFGERGLPLMGSGDWNDGMNTVGNKGAGESVWLGWFLYSILNAFAPICERKGEKDRAKKYITSAKKIAKAIEENGWDGSWYRRAYFDDGKPLGSVQNSECKIDSLAQTWAVISGGGSKERIMSAMNSVENYLIKRDEGLIKLLTPPFDEGELEPGYIKSYVPGVRENGGQYTHAAAWVVMAYAKMGDGEKAMELFELLNPINHSRTQIEYSKYKVEPYVMAADVYSVEPHTGRGGWTWYTGAAGWIYRVGFEYILGFKKNGESLLIDPCIPKNWSGFDIKYKFKDTSYVIEVKNPDRVNKGVKKVFIDNKEIANKKISLVNDKREHHIEVIMG